MTTQLKSDAIIERLKEGLRSVISCTTHSLTVQTLEEAKLALKFTGALASEALDEVPVRAPLSAAPAERTELHHA